MRKRIGRRRKKIPGSIIMLILTLFIIYTYVTTEKNVKPTLIAMSEIKAKLIATQAINEAVDSVMTKEDYSKLANILMDNTGKIAGVEVNTLKINKISGETTRAVQKSLEGLDAKTLKIPVSNLFGSRLLANIGPKINIKILPSGSVAVNYFTAFEAAGINQTRHIVYLNVKTNIKIVVPMDTNEVEVAINVPISEIIIAGEVPNSYISVPKDKNEWMNFVPIAPPSK